jgi:hypothetical protein
MQKSNRDCAAARVCSALIPCVVLSVLVAALDPARGGPPPAEERSYTFEMEDVTYAEILDEFARQSGLEIAGVPPTGKTSFNCCGEEMSFQLALNRLRLVLFNHPTRVWLRKGPGQLELGLVRNMCLRASLDHVFATLDAFRASPLADWELALVLYTPEEDASVWPALGEFLPTHVRGSRYAETNSVTLFGVAQDLRRYLALAQMLAADPDTPRELERFQLARLDCEQAVKCIRAVVGRVWVYESIETEAPRDESDPTALATSQPGPADVLVWVHPACRTLVVRAMPDRLAPISDLLHKLERPPVDRREEQLAPARSTATRTDP